MGAVDVERRDIPIRYTFPRKHGTDTPPHEGGVRVVEHVIKQLRLLKVGYAKEFSSGRDHSLGEGDGERRRNVCGEADGSEESGEFIPRAAGGNEDQALRLKVLGCFLGDKSSKGYPAEEEWCRAVDRIGHSLAVAGQGLVGEMGKPRRDFDVGIEGSLWGQQSMVGSEAGKEDDSRAIADGAPSILLRPAGEVGSYDVFARPA